MRIVEDRKATASRLGSYEVLHRFAAGGMAELFLARSVGMAGFEKLVVLKKILPRLATNERFVQLFLDEARLAASLDHPNITHVYDLGRVDGAYFFTMEYVHGRDLRSVLHRSVNLQTPLPIEHAVRIARDVSAALHYAHERCGADGNLLGIVHRDVSPSNILLAYEGTVKLLDFGVAKASTSSVKTRTGSLKGKVSYMAPEQAKGAAVDRRSDVFSVGIVLWEMVASRRLYKGPNDLATIQLIINHPPPAPSSLRAGCPPELDRIILRALAQHPDARYQTAAELQSDLEELARENKLNQSSIALGGHLGVLFAAEIKAWRQARAAGVSLAEHLLESSVVHDELTPSSEFSEEVVDGIEDDAEKTERTTPPAAPKRNNEEDRSSVRLSSGRTPPPQDHPVDPKEPSIVIEPELFEESRAELEARATPPPAELTFAAESVPMSDAGWRTPATIASRAFVRPSGRGKWIAFAGAGIAIAIGIVIVKSMGSSQPTAAELAPVDPNSVPESRTIELAPSAPAEVAAQPASVVTAPAKPVEPPAKPVEPPAAPKPAPAPVEAAKSPIQIPAPKPPDEAPKAPPPPVRAVSATPPHKPPAPPPPAVKRVAHPPPKPAAAAKFDPDAAMPP